jgi:hypothetical protein
MVTRGKKNMQFFFSKSKKPLRTKVQEGTHEQNMGFAKIKPPHP